MRPAVETMTDRAILEELLREKRRSETMRWIKIAVTVLVLILLAVLLFKIVPGIIQFFRNINDTMEQLRGGMDQIRETADGLKQSISGWSTNGLETIKEAAEKLGDLLNMLPSWLRP